MRTNATQSSEMYLALNHLALPTPIHLPHISPHIAQHGKQSPYAQVTTMMRIPTIILVCLVRMGVLDALVGQRPLAVDRAGGAHAHKELASRGMGAP